MAEVGPLKSDDPGEMVRCCIQPEEEVFVTPQTMCCLIEDDSILNSELLPRGLAERCDSAYRAWRAASAEAAAWWQEHGEPRFPVSVDDQWAAEQAAETERPAGSS